MSRPLDVVVGARIEHLRTQIVMFPSVSWEASELSSENSFTSMKNVEYISTINYILTVPSLLLLGILILRYVITSRGRPSGVRLPYVLGWLCSDTKATGSRMFRGAIALCRLFDMSSRPQVGVLESLVPGCCQQRVVGTSILMNRGTVLWVSCN